MFEIVREQWPVSVRVEDLEDGAFELPASGLFVVRGDYIVPASTLETKASHLCSDTLEDVLDVATPTTITYTLIPDYSFPQESQADEFMELGYSRVFRTGLRSTLHYLGARGIVARARRFFASVKPRA